MGNKNQEPVSGSSPADPLDDAPVTSKNPTTGNANSYLGLRLTIAAAWVLPSLFLLIAGLWICLYRSWLIYDFTLDDSFITYRYARHLVEGIGLIWNPGESPPVEGFTTFLWVIVNAVFELLRLDPVQSSKVLSYLALFMILLLMLMTPSVIYQWRPRYDFGLLSHPIVYLRAMLASAFIVAVFLVSPDTPPHVVSGMETMVATMLLLSFCLSLAYFDLLPAACTLGRFFNPRIIVLASLALLCGLIRPEFNAGIGIGFLSAWLLYRFGNEHKDNQQHAKTLLYAAILYIIVGLIYYLWRYQYYGLPFPLPFYIKQLQPSETLFKGAKTVTMFATVYWPYAILSLLAVMMNPKRLLPPFFVAMVICLYFYFPEHIMGLYFRFVYPILPILFWLSLATLHRAITYKFIPSPLWIIGLLFMAYTITVGTPHKRRDFATENQQWWNLAEIDQKWDRRKIWLLDYLHAEHRSLIPLGKAIAKDNGPPLKIAMIDLGAVAYYGDWNMIDLFGLTHPRLAQARSRGIYNADMLLAEKPDIVLLGEFFREKRYRGQFPFEKALYNRMPKYSYIPTARFAWNRVFGFLVFAKDEDAARRFTKILRSSKEIKKTLQVMHKN